jgi:hypothetical protein
MASVCASIAMRLTRQVVVDRPCIKEVLKNTRSLQLSIANRILVHKDPRFENLTFWQSCYCIVNRRDYSLRSLTPSLLTYVPIPEHYSEPRIR